MILDYYLAYLASHWWLHILLDVWLQIIVIAFVLWGCYSLSKRRKLRSQGKTAEGVVIDKFVYESENSDGNVQNFYAIKYIFSDLNTRTLVEGYSKHNARNLFIPSPIFDLITAYHGYTRLDRDAIIEQECIGAEAWQQLEIGHKVEILYHPKFPKLLQIPRLNLEYDSAKRYRILTVCSAVFLVVLTVWYYVLLMDDMEDNEEEDIPSLYIVVFTAMLLFLTYFCGSLIIVMLLYACYAIGQFRSFRRLNSSVMHAKYKKIYNKDISVDIDEINEQRKQNSNEEGKEEEMVILTTAS